MDEVKKKLAILDYASRVVVKMKEGTSVYPTNIKKFAAVNKINEDEITKAIAKEIENHGGISAIHSSEKLLAERILGKVKKLNRFEWGFGELPKKKEKIPKTSETTVFETTQQEITRQMVQKTRSPALANQLPIIISDIANKKSVIKAMNEAISRMSPDEKKELNDRELKETIKKLGQKQHLLYYEPSGKKPKQSKNPPNTLVAKRNALEEKGMNPELAIRIIRENWNGKSTSFSKGFRNASEERSKRIAEQSARKRK